MHRIHTLSTIFLLILLAMCSTTVEAVTSKQQAASQQVLAHSATASSTFTYPESGELTSRQERKQSRILKRIKKWIGKRNMIQDPKPSRKPSAGSGSGMAVASLVCGIVGLLFLPTLLASVVAIVLGVISRRKWKEGYHDRGGMAKAGLILGIIGASISFLYLLLILILISAGNW